MYLSFYKLTAKPFQISTDPAFLWLGEKHKEALAVLKYGILDNKGFLLLTGDVGTGKTTLINALVSSLGDEVVVATVPDPGMDKIDLMNFITHSFGMGNNFVRKNSFLVHFGHFLNSAYASGKKVLLIIDESQRLNYDLLEEVRQLSNIEKQEAKLLNIFLIGQNEFNDVLLEGKNRAVRQRIAFNYSLKALDVEETGQLIGHRLKVAGATQEIFNSAAIREIYEYSEGIPRRINIICDHCLISGFVKGKDTVTAKMVRACAEDIALQIPLKIKKTPSPVTVALPDSFDSDAQHMAKECAGEYVPVDESLGHWRVAGKALLLAVIVCGSAYLYMISKDGNLPFWAHDESATPNNILSTRGLEDQARRVTAKENAGTMPKVKVVSFTPTVPESVASTDTDSAGVTDNVEVQSPLTTVSSLEQSDVVTTREKGLKKISDKVPQTYNSLGYPEIVDENLTLHEMDLGLKVGAIENSEPESAEPAIAISLEEDVGMSQEVAVDPGEKIVEDEYNQIITEADMSPALGPLISADNKPLMAEVMKPGVVAHDNSEIVEEVVILVEPPAEVVEVEDIAFRKLIPDADQIEAVPDIQRAENRSTPDGVDELPKKSASATDQVSAEIAEVGKVAEMAEKSAVSRADESGNTHVEAKTSKRELLAEMVKYLPESEQDIEQAKTTDIPEDIYSGKVIDWVLSKRSE